MNKLTLSALLAAGALIVGPTSAADAPAGKTIAENSCVDCHGDDGKGDDENPGIAGMAVDKFTKAMTEYQNGTRTRDAKMAKAAKKLSAPMLRTSPPTTRTIESLERLNVSTLYDSKRVFQC